MEPADPVQDALHVQGLCLGQHWTGPWVPSWAGAQPATPPASGQMLAPPCCPSQAESPPPDLSSVPSSKSHATSLPPHCAYNCAIDLLPGTSPPRGRLYSLLNGLPWRTTPGSALLPVWSIPALHLRALACSSWRRRTDHCAPASTIGALIKSFAKIATSFHSNQHIFVSQDDILLAKTKNCEFNQSTVQFLGFIMSRGKLEMHPAKTQAAIMWPTPTNIKELFL